MDGTSSAVKQITSDSDQTGNYDIQKDLAEVDEVIESIQNQSYKNRHSRYNTRNTERLELEIEKTLPLRTSLATPAVRIRTRHSKSPHSLRRQSDSDAPYKCEKEFVGSLRRQKYVKNKDTIVLDSENEFASSLRRQKYVKNKDTNVLDSDTGNISEKEDRNLQNGKEFGSSLRRQKYRQNMDTSSYTSNSSSHRSSSVPKPRLIQEKEKESFDYDRKKEGKPLERNRSTLSRRDSLLIENDASSSHRHSYLSGEINEMIANSRISRASTAAVVTNFGSTESIVPGDLFFTQDYGATMTQPNNNFPRNSETKNKYDFQRRPDINSASQMKTNHSSSAPNRRRNHVNDFSEKTDKNNQEETCFSCIRTGHCVDSRKSPEKGRHVYEAAIIEKAFVVENVRQFWADKHQPASLSGFTCHKQEALLLKQLASIGIFPHILFKGPSGSGKKALTMALLREIFGPPVWNVSHELRYFFAQETRTTEIAVPISSSPHHVELNVSSNPNVTYALMALVKQISTVAPEISTVAPEISTAIMKADYKVLALYDVDKADDRLQHLIKWIMDCYADSCKLILCCEDDENILESVRSHCKVIDLEPPVTHEIMEVLSEIARKEKFHLPMSFAATIANKSKRNLRKAIMALEACKAHNYPFAEDQPIQIGWEDVLVELASELLADPSTDKLFLVRGQLRKLLASFVNQKLILLKLVQEFLKGVDAGTKREIYYWHAYYDKRLPSGTSAILKLEEFIAKFMSIHRKSHINYRHEYS